MNKNLTFLLLLWLIPLVFPCRGAAFEPSPAFQSRESGYVVFSVAERRLIPIIGLNRRSATESGNA